LHRSSKRQTPPAVKAALRRALRGLDGFSVGSVRDGHRDHGTVVRDSPVPPGLPSACGRRQTRRADDRSKCDADQYGANASSGRVAPLRSNPRRGKKLQLQGHVSLKRFAEPWCIREKPASRTRRVSGYGNWDEGGSNRVALHIAGGALIGGLGGGSIGTALQGAAGAGLSAAMAKQLDDIYKGVGSATGSELLGNIAANVVAGVGGALVGGGVGATTAANVELYNQSMHRKKDDLVSQVCAAGAQCSDAVLNAAIQAQGANADVASENIKTVSAYGAPAAAVVALGPGAVYGAVVAGGLDYLGSIYSYATGLTKDAPSFTSSYIAGVVGGLTYPFAIGNAAISRMGTAGKIAANVYNAGVAGVGAFGIAGMTGGNPDISAGFATGSAATGSLVKAMFPGPAGDFLNNLIQGAAGPIQNAVTRGASTNEISPN